MAATIRAFEMLGSAIAEPHTAKMIIVVVFFAFVLAVYQWKTAP